MFSRLAIALCLIVTVACRDGMPVRRDGAVADLAVPKDSSPSNDGPALAADLVVPDVGRDMPGPDLARDQLAADATVDSGAREDTAAEALDAKVTEAGRQDAGPDAADPEDARPDPDSAADAVAPPSDARPDATAIDSGLAAFCTGDQVRLATNGNAGAPAVRVTTLAMDCCDGVELELMTATFLYGIYVRWVLPAGSGAFPMDFDLSAPSRLRSFEVRTQCDSLRSNCADSYSSGFVGRLQLFRGDGGAGYEASLCVHVEQAPDSSHPALRSFDLYVPRIVIR